MGILSYSDLQTRMGQYLKRQDLNALLPDFIAQAEEWFDRNVYSKSRRSSYLFTPGQSVFPMPSDCKQPIKVWYDGLPLDFYPTGFSSGYANGKQGFWNGYQIEGDSIIISVAQLGQKFQLDYYMTLEPLSDTNESNWLLEDSQTLYLFGALTQAAIYVRDQVKLTEWMGLRDQILEDINDDDDRAQRPTDTLVIRAG